MASKEVKMPWSETNIMDARFAAVKEYHTGNYSKTLICEIYGISRPTFDKWLMRFDKNGWNGLHDLSCKPIHSPNKISEHVTDLILDHNEKKGWKNKKIHGHLELKHPGIEIPCPATIHNILKRHNRTDKYRRHKRWQHPGKPVYQALAPNDVLSADYKGEFKMGNRKYCYPLTITCNFSRFLLGAFAHSGPLISSSKRDFEKVFREYGLPKAILTDNGNPFSSIAINGLSQLSVWWTELGIEHLLTQPASPGQNGKHERMHREMKRSVTKPPGKDMEHQSEMLKVFQIDYNENLKHGGLDNATPASVYENSTREYPDKIDGPDYPIDFETRKVDTSGKFSWHNRNISVSKTLTSKNIGLEEIDDGLHKVWFYDRPLGFFDVKIGRLEDKPGRFSRLKCK